MLDAGFLHVGLPPSRWIKKKLGFVGPLSLQAAWVRIFWVHSFHSSTIDCRVVSEGCGVSNTGFEAAGRQMLGEFFGKLVFHPLPSTFGHRIGGYLHNCSLGCKSDCCFRYLGLPNSTCQIQHRTYINPKRTQGLKYTATYTTYMALTKLRNRIDGAWNLI